MRRQSTNDNVHEEATSETSGFLITPLWKRRLSDFRMVCSIDVNVGYPDLHFQEQ